MKKIFLKIFLILSPLTLFLSGIIFINGSSIHRFNGTQFFSISPMALSPTQSPSHNVASFSFPYNLFIPQILVPWVYLPITAPPNSVSIYIKDFSNNSLYNAGCEQGTKDRNLLGAQDSIVFLHFGQPYFNGTQYGVILHDTYQFKTMSEIANEANNYSQGYWSCTGWDTQSHIVLAIGTSNQFHSTVIPSQHGAAWAQMVFSANNLLSPTNASFQVSLAGASDMELEFSSPINTRSWVDGYDSVVFNQEIGGVAFNLYAIGNASGCAPYSGQCGSASYLWSNDDVWYISYGCYSCYPLPMIYNGPNTSVHAEQWQYLSKYAKQTHGAKILFRGTTTQYKACDQRPNDVTCPTNKAEDGYKQLYTKLNSDPDTEISQIDFKWSTDMKWWGPGETP